MNQDSRIYVAGHNGMVGSAIVRLLVSNGFNNIITRTSSELDLRNQESVNRFFSEAQPEYVFLAAAKVGGIEANNTFRADFVYDNVMISANVIHASYLHSVKKLLFLGSSCIYPKHSLQPIKEEYLLTGKLEHTNEPYAIAKIAGLKMCEAYRDQYGCDFITAMPTNLYGIGDNYHVNNSHVLPSLIRKIHEAKLNDEPCVTVWGDGSPRREFMFADDIADACLFLMLNYSDKEPINVGTGEDISIADLTGLLCETIGYYKGINYDTAKPNGTHRKLLDVSRLRDLGWRHTTDLKDGIRLSYNDYIGRL